MAVGFVQDTTPGPPGLNPKGLWNPATTYYTRDLVRFNGAAWVSLRLNVNVTPTTLSDAWSLLVEKGTSESNLIFKGPWSNIANFLKNNVVLYNGSSYVALQDSIGKLPSSEPTYWIVLASGGAGGPDTDEILDGGNY